MRCRLPPAVPKRSTARQEGLRELGNRPVCLTSSSRSSAQASAWTSCRPISRATLDRVRVTEGQSISSAPPLPDSGASGSRSCCRAAVGFAEELENSTSSITGRHASNAAKTRSASIKPTRRTVVERGTAEVIRFRRLGRRRQSPASVTRRLRAARFSPTLGDDERDGPSAAIPKSVASANTGSTCPRSCAPGTRPLEPGTGNLLVDDLAHVLDRSAQCSTPTRIFT